MLQNHQGHFSEGQHKYYNPINTTFARAKTKDLKKTCNATFMTAGGRCVGGEWPQRLIEVPNSRS